MNLSISDNVAVNDKSGSPHIVIVHSLYYPDFNGGAEISTQILAESLANDYKVTIITTCDASVRQLEDINGVNIIRLPHSNLFWIGQNKKHSKTVKFVWKLIDIYNFKHYRNLKLLFREIKPTLIHTQNLWGISFAVWDAAKKNQIPIIHTLRDYALLDKSQNRIFAFFYRQLAKYTTLKVDCVIGISNYILKRHLEYKLFTNAQRHVVLNVVENNGDLPRTQIEAKNPMNIGYFGRLVEEKGVKDLIAAMKHIQQQTVAKLLIYGEGPELEKLEALAKYDNRIQFMGKQEHKDIQKSMAKLDLIVVPSVWDEPFGRVLIEAYQVGTPVAATNVGGIPEIIFNAERFMFPPRRPDLIASAINTYGNLDINEQEKIREGCVRHSDSFRADASKNSHTSIYQATIMGRSTELRQKNESEELIC